MQSRLAAEKSGCEGGRAKDVIVIALRIKGAV